MKNISIAPAIHRLTISTEKENQVTNQDYRTAPYDAMNLVRLSRLHVLSLFAEANYSLDFAECGNEWCVTITYPGIADAATKSWTLLENALDDGIEILENYLNLHKIKYPLAGEVYSPLMYQNPDLILKYTRPQVQTWRNDIAAACANIATRYGANEYLVHDLAAMADAPVLRPAKINPEVQVVGWQYQAYHGENTVTHGWQPWENISEDKYKEIMQYIDCGYNYRVRKVYAEVFDRKDDRPACVSCGTRYTELHRSGCTKATVGTPHVAINYVEPVKE